MTNQRVRFQHEHVVLEHPHVGIASQPWPRTSITGRRNRGRGLRKNHQLSQGSHGAAAAAALAVDYRGERIAGTQCGI